VQDRAERLTRPITWVQQMIDTVFDNGAPETGEIVLTVSDAYRLLGACIDLIHICSKVTGRIDPALGSMLEYAREEALGELCFRKVSCN